MPHPDGGWREKVDGNTRATALSDTQAGAAGPARERARANDEELVIHGRDGRIKIKDSFGNDPRSSEG